LAGLKAHPAFVHPPAKQVVPERQAKQPVGQVVAQVDD